MNKKTIKTIKNNNTSKKKIEKKTKQVIKPEKEIKKEPKKINTEFPKEIKIMKFNKKKFIKFILIIILSCIFIFSITKLTINQIEMINNKKDTKKLIDDVITLPKVDNKDKMDEEYIPSPEEVQVDFGKLLSINSDTMGWMMFNNMLINYPVVKASDNEYYLHHNFYGNTTDVGAIFMDHRNSSFDDRNVVIFGHSNIDRTMFGSLYDVFQSGYFSRKNADIIYFYDTNNNLIKYQIFSYYIIEPEEYYIKTNFKSDASFQTFIDTIKGRSVSNRNIEVTTKDKILTLSTCTGNPTGNYKRRVIHAKRIQ